MSISAKRINNKRSLSFVLASTLLVAGAFMFTQKAQADLTATLEQTLQDGSGNGNPFFGDLYGEHVTSNDNWVVLGAPRESIDLDNNGTIDRPTNAAGQEERQVGAVYIYKRTNNGLVLHQTLAGFGNANNGNGDRFGSGVTLVGNQLMIGAANDTSFPDHVDPLDEGFFFAGKVYVYDYNKGKDTWVKSKEVLTSDVPISNGAFGTRTDANRIISFPKHNALVITESGNSSQTYSKIHVFKKNRKQWDRTQVILSQRYDELGNSVGLGDRAQRAGDSHLLLSEFNDSEHQLLVYKFDDNDVLSTSPVQAIDGIVTPLVIPEDITQGIINKVLKGFGIPKKFKSDFSGFFADNVVFCDEVLATGGTLIGMAAAKDIVVVGDPCATPDGNYNELYGLVNVYTLDENSNTPLTLKQVIEGPRDSLYYGSHFAGGTQTIATDGEHIVIGTATFLDPFGFPVQNYPVIAEPQVDVYKLQDGMFVLGTSIASPDPSIDNGGVGSFYGISNHFLSTKGDAQLLISNGGVAGNGGGKVYRFSLD